VILVDTSVVIDYLKGKQTQKSELFDRIIDTDLDFCISVLTYQELLQGAKNDKEFEQIKSFFATGIILPLPTDKRFFEQSAQMYFTLRRQGKTVRSTIDTIIAAQAVSGGYILLHDDRDYDVIAETFADIKILSDLTV
jgi:hypothetical protein